MHPILDLSQTLLDFVWFGTRICLRLNELASSCNKDLFGEMMRFGMDFFRLLPRQMLISMYVFGTPCWLLDLFNKMFRPPGHNSLGNSGLFPQWFRLSCWVVTGFPWFGASMWLVLSCTRWLSHLSMRLLWISWVGSLSFTGVGHVEFGKPMGLDLFPMDTVVPWSCHLCVTCCGVGL